MLRASRAGHTSYYMRALIWMPACSELALNITDPLCFDMPGARIPSGMVLLGAQAPVWEEDHIQPSPSFDQRQQAVARAKTLFGLPLFVLRLIRPCLSRGFKERAFHADTLTAAEAGNLGDAATGLPSGHSRRAATMLQYASALSGANSMAVCKAFYSQTLAQV